MSAENALSTIRKFYDILSQSNLISDFGHLLGWGIVSLLKLLVDAAEELVDKSYELLTLSSIFGNGDNNSGIFSDILDATALKTIFMILFAISIICLGLMLMFSNGKTRSSTVKNILIAVIFVTATPTAFNALNTLVYNAADSIRGSEGSAAQQIIVGCVTDLKYVNTQGWTNYEIDGKTLQPNEGFYRNAWEEKDDKSTINNIDVNECLDDDAFGGEDKRMQTIFGYEFIISEEGIATAEPLKESSWFGINFTSWYYRYSVDWISLIMSLGTTALGLILMGIKVVKIIYELIFTKLLGSIVAAADIHNGQRITAIFTNVISLYVGLLLISVNIKIYYSLTGVISSLGWNGIVKGFMLLFLAIAMMDGPNLVEKILGLDIGFKSGFGTLYSVARGAQFAGTVAKTAGKVTAGVAKGTVGAVSGGIGFGRGLFGSNHNNGNSNVADEVANNTNSNENIHSNTNSIENMSSDSSQSIGDNKSNDNQTNHQNDSSINPQSDSNSNISNGVDNTSSNKTDNPIQETETPLTNQSSNENNIADRATADNTKTNYSEQSREHNIRHFAPIQKAINAKDYVKGSHDTGKYYGRKIRNLFDKNEGDK